MIELVQFPWSPFCIVQRRILEFARARFKVVNVPVNDRSLVWRLTRQRYYQVPILKEGRTVVFEADDGSQVLAKYLDERFQLGLFPHRLEGIQSILWQHIESEIEGFTFRLNDIYWRELLPRRDWLGFVRHKERRFGHGCLESWQHQQTELQAGLARALVPFEQMLLTHPFLLDDHPRFVDFDLFGMLQNYLYSGHYQMPKEHPRLDNWFARMQRI